jgi:predicted PurR-regulated permease PerM
MLVMLGYICMVVSLVISPIIFGPLAIILGFINKRRGSVFHGRNQIYMGIVCFLIGWAFGVIVLLYNDIIDEAQDISREAIQKLENIQKAGGENSPSPVPQSTEQEP